MQNIPSEQVIRRIQSDNGWWIAPNQISPNYRHLRQRAYFSLLFPLINSVEPRRAVLLMGPRRVGKTVLMFQTIQNLMDVGVPPKNICYLSVDHPIFNGQSLENLLDLYAQAAEIELDSNSEFFVFFDEIQYLKEWEVHLKNLVDRKSNIKFVASGSSAAALRLKSIESGAGRFTDFLLPPLTFHEFLDLSGQSDLVVLEEDDYVASDIVELNRRFISYLNFGGYPEVMFSETIQADPGRFIKSDIIDRVLLRDLPSLYGIQDIQELNYLFTTLAFNTSNEVSLEHLSNNSGVAKNTIRKYIEYLEAAFLIKLVHRIDRNARHFQRANFFKVYLTNPSMWSALFGVLDTDDPAMGQLAETAIFSQWFHSPSQRYYARWDKGEVDIVGLNANQRPLWAIEVKWSDQFVDSPSKLKSLISFCSANKIPKAVVTTRTIRKNLEFSGIDLQFKPISLYCWMVGYNLVKRYPQTGINTLLDSPTSPSSRS